MTRQFTAIAIAALALLPASAFAQASANPFTDAVKGQFTSVKTSITRTADKVGEDLYAFKPTPDVRSLGQLIGHIADGNYGICGAASGMKPTAMGIEKGMTTKAAMQKLNKSFEHYVYPHATHGFLEFQDLAGNPTATADSWEKTIQFLRKHTM